MTTLRNVVPGNGVEADESDNWAITWADDDHQYASFGDGQGFRTTNTVRGSLGVSRIEGDKLDYSAFDVFKVGVETGGCGGKSVGILAVGSALYMFRNGTGSGGSAFRRTELYESTNKGKSWSFTGVKWVNNNFIGSDGFFSPSFLQFGKGYAGARDEFVYVYAPEETTSVDTDTWNVQIPGKISLLRVPKVSLTDQSTYEYFAGLDGAGNPLWTTDINGRLPAFEDPVNGIMRTSVSFNAGLGRYLLITQQVNRFRNGNFHIGIYEAPEPWGPWQTILFENAEQAGPGLNVGKKTVFWNFSNKWLSPDGRNFVLVYTGPGADQWGTVEGTFLTPP
ncbi:DUF4185 domain-containing protein [Thiogranum longum]|nr:DUF4185 domain-containing protein [Thiogranum longum]